MGTLKEIENKHYKECNVVMLPTKDDLQPPFITIRQDRYGDWSDHPTLQIDKNDGRDNPHHLHITSDDDIEPFEKCWIYDSDKNNIFYNGRKENTKGLTHTNFYHKIIATTDKSLFLYKENTIGVVGHSFIKTYLPQPSQSFIKKYCELGGIDKVLVEYTQNRCHGHLEYTTNSGIPGDWYVCIKCDNIQKRTQNGCINNTGEYKLKTDSHNTITIKSVKNSWTREEVIDIIYKSSFVLSNGDTTKEHADNWINKNL